MVRSPLLSLLVASLVPAAAALVACGGSSASPPGHDAGGTEPDGGGTANDGGPGEDGSKYEPDGAPKGDAATGTWGPCSLASVGDPGAVPIKMVTVQAPGAATACGGASAPLLFQTAQQYETFELSLGAGTVGASVDGGAPYATLIDWTTYSLVVLDTQTSDALTAGAQGVNGDEIILTRGQLCQGVAPSCTETAYQVPAAATVSLVDCAPPATACTAP